MELFIVHKNILNPSTSNIAWEQFEKISINDEISLSYRKEFVQAHKQNSWFFLWYGEFGAEPDFNLLADRLESDRAEDTWGGRGVCIAINQQRNEFKIINDSYGSFPVFFSRSFENENVIASSSVSAFDKKETDWTSFYQFLSLGYIVGEYSIFSNVARLMANSMLSIIGPDGNIQTVVHRLKNFWDMGGAVTEAKVDSLIDILRFESGKMNPVMLMMSGGWDSRLLLAAMQKLNPVLYTHGNLASREIAIVRDLAAVLRLELIEHDFSSDHFDECLFQGYLEQNESLMFSHWASAGRLASSRGLVMTAGTFGEVLGGHYGTLNTLPSKKKYLSLSAHMLGVGGTVDRYLNLQDSQQVYEILKISNYDVFWMLKEETSKRLKQLRLIEESNDRLQLVMASYRNQGTDNAQTIYERFYTEHRGGQYINLQLKNAAVGGGFRNAFTNQDLISIVSSIKFEDRAHNKINKKIVRKMCPELLKFPLAATLANAGKPLLVQEFSRAARKVVERRGAARSVYNATCRYPNKEFGWNDFSGVVDERFVERANLFLTSDFWKHAAVERILNNGKSENMYPFFDMLSKAMTLDHWLKV